MGGEADFQQSSCARSGGKEEDGDSCPPFRKFVIEFLCLRFDCSFLFCSVSPSSDVVCVVVAVCVGAESLFGVVTLNVQSIRVRPVSVRNGSLSVAPLVLQWSLIIFK